MMIEEEEEGDVDDNRNPGDDDDYADVGGGYDGASVMMPQMILAMPTPQ